VIAAQNPSGSLQYRIAVLRDPTPKAFALSNASIYLSAGALARVDDEAQLAFVIAHLLNELALDHPLGEYYGRRGRAIARDLSLGVAREGPQIPGVETAPFFYIPFGAAFANSARDRQEEADLGGIQWLTRAGFATATAPAVLAVFREIDDYGNEPCQAYCSSLVERAPIAANPGGRNDVAGLRRATQRVALESVSLRVKSGEYALAIEDAERMSARYGESAPLQYYQGESRLRLLALDRAQKHMRRALELDPGYRPAQRGVGEVLLAQGNAAEAEAVFAEYLRANPNAPDAGAVDALLRQSHARAANGSQPP